MTEMFLTGIVLGISLTLLILWVGVYIWLNQVGAIVIELPKENDAVQDQTVGDTGSVL